MNRDKLKNLIQSLLDGQITPADLESLLHELETSEQARQLYVEFSELHSMLVLRTTLVKNVVPIDRIIRRQKRRSVKIAAFAAAAVVVLGLMAMQLFFIKEKPPTLSFVTSPGTQYVITHDGATDAPEGLVLGKGSRLQISQGTVELTFGSGVKSIVMAPADMTLHGDDTLYLNKGTAWFQVPKGAEGFTVKTPELDIVDLGTEFGVLSTPDNHDELHVFKGKVQVTAKRLRKETATLIAGEARRIDPVGRLATIPCKATAFITSLPLSLPYFHWSFDGEDHLQAGGTHPAVTEITTSVSAPNKPLSFRKGKQGNSVLLDGIEQNLATNWTGFGKNRPRTVSFWLKLPSLGDYTRLPGIVGWGDKTHYGNSKWKILAAQDHHGGKTYLRLSWGVTWINGSTNLTRDQWHHITVTSSGKSDERGLPTAEIYINGKREPVQYAGEISNFEKLEMDTATHTENALPLVIGKTLRKNAIRNVDYFNGEIDELYIFEGHMNASSVEKLVTP